jgi:hypothetical protein
MKVISKGTSITEVPGLSEILIEPDESSEHGVHITLVDNNDGWPEKDTCPNCGYNRNVMGFTVGELEQLRDALTTALMHANSLAGEL